jgi:Protein of unknown function (DUF3131)
MNLTPLYLIAQMALPLPPPLQLPAYIVPTDIAKAPPIVTATPSPTPSPTPPIVTPVKLQATLQPLSPTDRAAAKMAWKYFEHNWDQKTGLVHSVDRLPWTTIWDQGSALLGIHAARQLGLMTPQRFQQRIGVTLSTLEKLPLTPDRFPHKAYDTETGVMLDLAMRPDPRGSSGYSALDVIRLLSALHIFRTEYPELRPQIERIVARWPIAQLEKDGWIYGVGRDQSGKLQRFQEGRSGYEQYAAYVLQLWGINATQALNNPDIDQIEVEGYTLEIDRRNLANSGASNYLTNDPYLLLAMEVGLPTALQPQMDNLLAVQAKRFERTGILTAVNEDSLDRFPYFLYYNVYANGQIWEPITVRGKPYPHLRFLSTKAAFAWAAIKPDQPYPKALRQAVQNLGDIDRGYYSGRYENRRYGDNRAININTNAIILESLLYRARQGQPLAQSAPTSMTMGK